MYIICLFEQYYVKLNEANWDEIYNPHFASTFKSAKIANSWIVQNTNLKEYAVPVSQKETVEKYDKWMETGGVRRTFSFMNNELSRKYNNESAEEVLAWRFAIEPDSLRYEDYRTWPELHQKFQNLFSLERFHNKDYTETYASVQLYFKKNSDFEIFKKELNLALPNITKLEDGYKLFNVMDHFLSEGGNSVNFLYRSEDDCLVDGRWATQIKGSLKKCFDYLIEERYYGD